MRKNLILICLLSLLNYSCSNGGDSVDMMSEISPPEFLHGNWETPAGMTEFNMSANNLIETSNVYNLISNERISYDYNELFDNDQFVIEEVTTANSYEIRVSNTSNTVEFLFDSLFRVPVSWRFERLSDGRIAVFGVGYSNGVFLTEIQ